MNALNFPVRCSRRDRNIRIFAFLRPPWDMGRGREREWQVDAHNFPLRCPERTEIERMSLRDAAQHRHDVMMMQRDIEHLKECYVREVRNAMN